MEAENIRLAPKGFTYQAATAINQGLPNGMSTKIAISG